jgi:competence protein ComEC
MAISGLHIGLVAGLAFWLARRIWMRSAWLCGLWPASRGAALAALLAAAAYAALAGFSLPTQRALIMLAVALGAVLLARNLRPVQALAAALILVLVFDPPASLAPGFWLSFGAVAAIVYLAAGRLRRPRGAGHWMSLQLGLGLALLPLLLWFFQSAPLIAPLANALAIPWVGLVIVPMTLLATAALTIVPIVGEWGLQSIELLLRPVWPVLGGLADLPLARWEAPTPSATALVFAVAGLMLLLAPRGVPGRWLGTVLVLPILLGGHQGPPAGGFRLTVLDVGQGLAAVVQTSTHVLVFDAGARFGGGLDIGRAALVPFLRAGGVGEVDRLVVSHGDIDHSGGARSVLDSLPVGDVLVGPGVGALHRRQEPCRTGQHWSWDGVYFSVLNPDGGVAASENDGSCVVRVDGAGGAVLLIADIEAPAESRLLATYGGQLRADVLLVPHHGSRSSSSLPFLDAVEPRWAIVSAGYRNRYGFPKDAVCRRYADQGIPIRETAVEGAVTIDVHPTQGPDAPRGYRGRARRYWHIPKDGNCSPL